ncbi:MAG: hypothetical protein LBU21_08930 [Treponema sp.]|jgi:hypothetical protein|nr:hypothetical protein [Treponema sp.]
MKRKNRLLPITFCASAMLHAGAFLFLAVETKSLAGTPEPERDAGVFSLVNISVPDEPEPPKPRPEPTLLPEPATAIPEPENGPAEIFIVTEAIPPAAEEPAVPSVVPSATPAELPAAFPAASGTALAGTTERTGGTGP